MNPPITQIPGDTWLPATWENYLCALGAPAHAKSKGYYSHGHMRLEMQLSVGFDHSKDHGIRDLQINKTPVILEGAEREFPSHS